MLLDTVESWMLRLSEDAPACTCSCCLSSAMISVNAAWIASIRCDCACCSASSGSLKSGARDAAIEPSWSSTGDMSTWRFDTAGRDDPCIGSGEGINCAWRVDNPMIGDDSERANGGLLACLEVEAGSPSMSRSRRVANGERLLNGESSVGAARRPFASMSATTRNQSSERWKSSKSCSISRSTWRCASMTLRRTRLSDAGVDVAASCPNERIVSTCFFATALSTGSGAGLEKYSSLMSEMSSLSVADWPGSSRGSSSSSDPSVSTDSSGFLKLSTVSQNCTSSERFRRSMNSMRYDSELGLVKVSLSVRLSVFVAS